MRYYIGAYLNTEAFSCYYSTSSEKLAKYLCNYLVRALCLDCTVLSSDEAIKDNIAVVGG